MINGTGAGKGSTPRRVDSEAYAKNYDSIFRKSTDQIKQVIANSESSVCDCNQLDNATKSWKPISTAPRDGSQIVVYCPSAHGIDHMASIAAYEDYAAFCVDELREPTLWIPIPNARAETPGETE